MRRLDMADNAWQLLVMRLTQTSTIQKKSPGCVAHRAQEWAGELIGVERPFVELRYFEVLEQVLRITVAKGGLP